MGFCISVALGMNKMTVGRTNSIGFDASIAARKAMMKQTARPRRKNKKRKTDSSIELTLFNKKIVLIRMNPKFLLQHQAREMRSLFPSQQLFRVRHLIKTQCVLEIQSIRKCYTGRKLAGVQAEGV